MPPSNIQSLNPVMRWIVGGHAVTKQAASSSQMGRFETEVLANEENLAALADLSDAWIDKVHGRQPPTRIILDMDSSVSPTHGEQEGSTYRRTMVTSAAPATIPYSCSTSSAIWNGVPCAPVTSTALMTGKAC